MSMPGEESIVAVSSAPGQAAISVIRLTGHNSLGVAAKVFRRGGGRAFPAADEDRRLVLGHVVEPLTGEAIDEVLVVAMRAPRTYTGEDVVEFHCHGGWTVQQAVVRALLEAGARPAEAGEFTRRAFLNGRMDLAQAEAVADLIKSRSRAALKVALRQLEGGLSERVRELRARLIGTLGLLEAQIDFSDEDVGDLDRLAAATEAERVAAELDALIAAGLEGRYLQDGVRVAIVGRPNVGKSSLLNALVMRERAIVSEIPGTTRDSIEEYVDIAGVPVTLVDTAGMHSAADGLERLGVERAEMILRTADLALVVVDLSVLSEQRASAGAEASGAPVLPEEPSGGWDAARTLLVGNKLDLMLQTAGRQLADALQREAEDAGGAGMGCCLVSARTGEGLEVLRGRIREMVLHGSIIRPEDILLTNERQIGLAREAAACARMAAAGLRTGRQEELVAEDVRAAAVSLGRITGDDVVEDLLDEVFSHFCIGK